MQFIVSGGFSLGNNGKMCHLTRKLWLQWEYTARVATDGLGSITYRFTYILTILSSALGNKETKTQS